MNARRIKNLLAEAIELSKDRKANASRIAEIRLDLGRDLPPAVGNVYSWAMKNRPEALNELFPLFLDYRLNLNDGQPL
jgi:hypothetical protein